MAYYPYRDRCFDRFGNYRCGPKPPTEERPKVSFETGKPVCSSGAATQSSTRVQKLDGSWTTVSTGAWVCPYAPRLGFGSGPKPTL